MGRKIACGIFGQGCERHESTLLTDGDRQYLASLEEKRKRERQEPFFKHAEPQDSEVAALKNIVCNFDSATPEIKATVLNFVAQANISAEDIVNVTLLHRWFSAQKCQLSDEHATFVKTMINTPKVLTIHFVAHQKLDDRNFDQKVFVHLKARELYQELKAKD